jgi:hypothetical protein
MVVVSRGQDIVHGDREKNQINVNVSKVRTVTQA